MFIYAVILFARMKPPTWDAMTSTDTHDVAVLMADLAGFTALTEAHGDRAAAETGTCLLELAQTASAGRPLLSKTLGDGVLLLFAHPRRAADTALTLLHEVHANVGMPAVRIVLHAGPALARQGDWFGASLNVAARVCDQAPSGSVTATGAFLDALGPLADLEAVPMGSRRLRDVRTPADVHELRRCGHPHDRTVDPVCRMTLPDDPPVSRSIGDELVGFCSTTCADEYERDRNRPPAAASSQELRA